METHPLIKLLAEIQRDLTTAKARLAEIQRQVASFNLAPPSDIQCPTCDLRFRSTYKLAEHVYVSHKGPVPEHWLEAELRTAEPESPSTTSSKTSDERR